MRQVTHKKPKHNRIFAIFLLFFFGGYAFFFSSPLWITDRDGAYLTEIGIPDTSSITGRSITLVRWEYSPEQELMELEIDIHNSAADGVDQYTYTADTKPNSEITLKKMVEDPTYTILQLQGVTEAMRDVLVRVTKVDPITETEQICRLYTNSAAVTRVDNITDKTVTEYRMDRVEREITRLKETIVAAEKSIEDLTSINENLDKTNEALTAMVEITAKDEGAKLEEQIAGNEATKKNNLKTIEELKKAIQTDTAEIKRLTGQMEKLQ